MINLRRRKQWISLVTIMGVLLPIHPPQASEISLIPSDDLVIHTNLQAKSQQSFWQRRPKRPLTIRSGAICAISPGLIDTIDIWSNRPLFIWQDMGNQVRVRNHNPDDKDQVLWEKSITAQASLRYEGQELQPGQLYQWQVVPVDPATSNATSLTRSTSLRTWTTFRILSTAQRQAIASALHTLEQNLQRQNASAEDIALSKADFFVDRGLWSDALQVLHEVNNPSDQFVQQRSAYVAALCKPFTP
jgi:Domain of Unknown Function (DUF928)